MATSVSGGRSRSTRREQPTMDKQLVSFITCDCESSAPFIVIYKGALQKMVRGISVIYIPLSRQNSERWCTCVLNGIRFTSASLICGVNTSTLENTNGAIKKGQSRETGKNRVHKTTKTGNIGYIR